MEKRKLAAIMFTDIVDYTAMAQANESLALQFVQEQQKIIRAILPRYEGQEIKTTGDGFLVSFSSSVEAARCAIAIQKAIQERNKKAASEKQFLVRIGIHVGDIVYRGGDVIGDGVNIASRIQSVANPGGIFLSVDVARQIENKVEASLIKLGQAELKNIKAPLEIYRIALPWEKESAAQRTINRASSKERLGRLALVFFILILVGSAGWWLFNQNFVQSPPIAISSEARSIAVLPFANLSNDPENEYFSDGMTEELINALSKLSDWRVAARTSTFVFKGQSEDVRKIGAQLNVRIVLEGSVRRSGDKLKITAQLIDATNGYHIWSETFDREVKDIFAIQEEIAQSIAIKLSATSIGTPAPPTVLVKATTQNNEAYDLYLKGRYYWNKRTKEGFQKAIQYFEEAIQFDPNYARAYAGLADSYSLMASYGFLSDATGLARAKEAATKAITLDETLAEAHTSLAYLYKRDRKWEESERSFKRAIELNPNYATAHHWYSTLLAETNRETERLVEIEKALALDPLSLIIKTALAEALLKANRFKEALEYLNQVLTVNSQFLLARLMLVSIKQLYEKDFEGAERELKKLSEEFPSDARVRLVYAQLLLSQSRFAESIELVKQAQEIEPESTINKMAYGLILYSSGRFDEAITILKNLAATDAVPTDTYSILGAAYYLKAMYHEAMQEWVKALIQGETFLSQEEKSKLLDEAESIFTKEEMQSAVGRYVARLREHTKKTCGLNAYTSAILYVLSGKQELSLDCLEEALKENQEQLFSLKVEPLFGPLRSEPRFIALLKELKLEK
jgi:TolB-like protein/class 3 adenylate cyclase/Flp pilus assembly protein TadD